MAAEELKKEELAEGLQLQDREKIANPEGLLNDSLEGLKKFGGFQLLKGLIKGIDNMNPKRKAVKNIFLQDSAYAEARKNLRNELSLWVDILSGETTDPMAIIDDCKEKCAKAERNLKTNLYNVHDEIKNLEITYRSLDSFFANAGQGKVDCLTLMNVNKEELEKHDSEDTIAIRDELEKYYDRLSLRNNYSLLVVPGYLGDSVAVRMWAQTAYKNKVIMISDFKDSLNFEMLKEELDDAQIQSQDAYMANMVMTCNYILGRKKSELAEEDDDVYIPGSASLAGRMSNTDPDDGGTVIAQGAAGVKYGTLDSVKGARLDLRKSEIAALIDFGVIPMVEEEGRTMAFSNRSLYNGATLGLQEYPIVRTFDWIGKVFQNFFNAEYGRNWDNDVKAELVKAVHDFLSDYKGPGRLIENYNLKKLDQDPKTKDIKIEVELKPFFAAKNFFIELTGHNGNTGYEYEADIK